MGDLTLFERIKQDARIQLLVIYTRFLLGGVFVFASIIKIKGLRFTSESGEGMPMDSALHFFETLYRTDLYWKFIGWSQLTAGFLLMTQRYAKLGALIFLLIMLNIFVITLSLDFNYTAAITGMRLLAGIMLFSWHWNEYRILINLDFFIQFKFTDFVAF